MDETFHKVKEKILSREDAEFITLFGVKMKNMMVSEIEKHYPSTEEFAYLLFAMITNFVTNTMAEMSKPDHLNTNLKLIIKNIESWIKEAERVGIRVNWSDDSNEIKINNQGIH